MSNLEKEKKNDVSIAIDGEGFIGTNTLGKLIDVDEAVLLHHIKARASRGEYRINEINQLDEESLILTIGFHASKDNEHARDLLMEMALDGVRAFLYDLAGITNTPDRIRIEKLEHDLAEETKKVKVQQLILDRKFSENHQNN